MATKKVRISNSAEDVLHPETESSIVLHGDSNVETTLDDLTSNAVTSVTATGTSPLTLSASKSGNTATVTGSVDLSAYAKTSDLPTLSDLGGVGSVSASGTSPLTLSASKSGTAVTISGNVDLSDYAKTTDLPTLSGLGGVGSISTSATSPLSLSASKSGTTVTISGSVDTYDKSTIDSMIASATDGGITNITASGTSPLTLNASVSGTSASITGSVNLSDYAKSADVPTKTSELTNDSGFITSSDIPATPTLSDLGGVGSVSASGTSPLSLSASKSGTSVSISGSVDLSSYAKTTDVDEAVEKIGVYPFDYYFESYDYVRNMEDFCIAWVIDDRCFYYKYPSIVDGITQIEKIYEDVLDTALFRMGNDLYMHPSNSKDLTKFATATDVSSASNTADSAYSLANTANTTANTANDLANDAYNLAKANVEWHPNIIKDGNFSNGDVSYEGKGYWWDRTEAGKLESDDTYGWHFYSKGTGYLYSNQQTNCCTSGTTYTISFYAWGTAAVTVYVGGASQAITLNSTATRYEITLTATSTASPRFRMTTDGETFYLALVKCEEGSSASAWSPHPSEIKLY